MSRFKASTLPLAPRSSNTAPSGVPAYPAAPQAAAPVLTPTYLTSGSGAVAQARPEVMPRVATHSNPLHKIGFLFATAYVAMQFGFINELINLLLGFRPFLPYVLGPPALLAALLSGRLRAMFSTRLGYFMIGLYVFLCASVPFSIVHSNSLFVLKDTLITAYSVFFMVTTLCITLRQTRFLMHVIALCAVLDLLASYRLGVVRADGRFSLAAGSMANANDFATHLLVALPFCLLSVFEKGRSVVVRIAMLVASGMFVLTALHTGSRSAIICLVVIGCFAVWKGTPSQRIALFVLTLLAAGMVPVIAPQTWTRFVTLFDSSAAATSGTAESAQESTNARLDLLRRSIEVTIHHPLFGVGIGEFQDAEAGIATSEGVRAHWQVTHNAYTQVSSEAGIPAMICFAGLTFGSIGICLRLYHRARQAQQLASIAAMAFFLLLSFTCLAVAMFFDSLSYTYYVPLLSALTVALWNSSQDSLREARV